MRPLKEWTNGTPENNYQDGTQLDAADFESWSKELVAVLTSAGIVPAANEFDQLLNAIKKIAWGTTQARPTTLSGYGITDAVTRIASGQPLPAQNIGPIWHDDYNGLLTWQVFNANGANYTGYASVLVGSLLLDTQSTPRSGYVKSGVQNLSKTAYAALRAWAMHNGILVAVGAWQAGQIVCADNADGTTFRVYDVRGEFLRTWDDGRGIDGGRLFGSYQKGSVHAIDIGNGIAAVGDRSASSVPSVARNDLGYDAWSSSDYPNARESDVTASTSVPIQDTTDLAFGVTRPRNTALLASIKF